MKAIFTSLLLSAATAVHLKAKTTFNDIAGANNVLIRSDIENGYIDPSLCTGKCWDEYVSVMSHPAVVGDTIADNIIHAEWDAAGWYDMYDFFNYDTY